MPYIPGARTVVSVFALTAVLLCAGTIVAAQSQQIVSAPTPAPSQRRQRPPRTTPQQRRLIRHNESGAIRTLHTPLSGEATYQATTGNGNYGTLAELRNAMLIDYVLAEGHRFGYPFSVRREKRSTESQASLELTAVPRSYGRTGRRSFYMDESGVIHAADKRGAEAHRGDHLLVIDP